MKRVLQKRFFLFVCSSKVLWKMAEKKKEKKELDLLIA